LIVTGDIGRRLQLLSGIRNMKKTVLFALVLLMGVFSTGAHAWGYEKLKLEGRNVRISDIKAGDDYGKYIIQPNDVGGGIYVVAAWNLSSTEILPNTTKVIREYMASKGLKIADKLEGSSIAIRFAIDGVNCDTAPAQSGQSNSDAALIAGAARAAIDGLQAGLFQYGISQGGKNKDFIYLDITGHIIFKPSEDLMHPDFYKKIDHSDQMLAAYNKSDKSTAEDVVRVMVDQWMKNYMSIEK
jgi:hypothetical protein